METVKGTVNATRAAIFTNWSDSPLLLELPLRLESETLVLFPFFKENPEEP
jgi:hypothetical protein